MIIYSYISGICLQGGLPGRNFTELAPVKSKVSHWIISVKYVLVLIFVGTTPTVMILNLRLLITIIILNSYPNKISC